MKKYRVTGWIAYPFQVEIPAETMGQAKAIVRHSLEDRRNGRYAVFIHNWKIRRAVGVELPANRAQEGR